MVDAQNDLAINCGSNFSVKAHKIDMKSNECYIKAPKGKISVKDISWGATVFAGTSALGSYTSLAAGFAGGPAGAAAAKKLGL